ncbi:MAG TPA: hemerythrin domain-containing protein [Oleiagrimonas sp.]|nr:hemerythrin domain-containing protein [Oleiagrimonas sp.]
MGFFRKMFGQGDAGRGVSTLEPPPATPHRVGYDPKLLDALLSDHARLGAMFERIGKSSEAGDYNEVCKLLTHFKSSLQAHILTENVRFYTYVETMTASDRDSAKTMHDFRRDMNTIARQVVDFIKKYQACDFASRTEREQFAKDYATVGGLLEQRLDSEENDLYPLYVAS